MCVQQRHLNQTSLWAGNAWIPFSAVHSLPIFTTGSSFYNKPPEFFQEDTFLVWVFLDADPKPRIQAQEAYLGRKQSQETSARGWECGAGKRKKLIKSQNQDITSKGGWNSTVWDPLGKRVSMHFRSCHPRAKAADCSTLCPTGTSLKVPVLLLSVGIEGVEEAFIVKI